MLLCYPDRIVITLRHCFFWQFSIKPNIIVFSIDLIEKDCHILSNQPIKLAKIYLSFCIVIHNKNILLNL